jgi:hypothetical protein
VIRKCKGKYSGIGLKWKSAFIDYFSGPEISDPAETPILRPNRSLEI